MRNSKQPLHTNNVVSFGRKQICSFLLHPLLCSKTPNSAPKSPQIQSRGAQPPQGNKKAS